MVSFRFFPWLALVLLWGPSVHAQLPALPFVLDDPDGIWRLAPAARALPDGIQLVALGAPRAGPVRLLVFKAPLDPAATEPLATFATRLRRVVLIEPVTQLRSAPAKKIGYTGHLLTLEAPRADGVFACEIFTFTVGADHWGLLQIIPASSPEGPAFAALKKAPPVPPGATALAPFRVSENPLTSFALSLRVEQDRNTERLSSIVVTEVPPDSVTERAGVKVGDRILRVDDRPVSEFASGIGRRSEIGKILIDRAPGSTVALELVTPGDAAPRRVVLTSGRLADPFRPR